MPYPPERPANPHTCHGVFYIRAAPATPRACSRAPALPIPSAPDHPDTSADTSLKPALALSFVWTFERTVESSPAPTSALPHGIPPAPALTPLPSCPALESPPNTAFAFFSLPDPPLVPDFGGYPRNLSRSPIVPILC